MNVSLSFTIMILSFSLIVLIINIWRSTRLKNLTRMEQENERLQNEIDEKIIFIEGLKREQHSLQVDTRVNLPYIVNDVLNIYEESNIQVPADIIETISVMHFNDETEVFQYIENQRNYWKLENTKKPYRKV